MRIKETDIFSRWMERPIALDGEASLDGEQISYKLFDEEGNELTGSGDIEASAYEAFMEEE